METKKSNSGNRNSGNHNSGDYNSGNRNSGYCNSGNHNSGDYNSGNRNSGHCNSGHRNSGHYNSGDYNSGNRNSGHCNSGHCNSGDYNSGDYNSGNYNSGWFNTNEPKMRFFNKESDFTYSEMYGKLPHSMEFYLTKWISETNMTESEKKENPNFYATEGYLKEFTYKEAWENFWRDTDEENKQKFLNLPNFDAKIFEEITGIDVNNCDDTKKKELLIKANELIEKANELKNQAEKI